ncbi:nuclear transport factor 2 family protein [Pandoraea bronchicola]|uniref:nuclear transport factor 2 family protein n=1 Tax=Pandoraea bronchicola TaxID=2508287 RepID=UPI001FE42524|nr:nuclear transport factor 2 family protein [Pandoraea bronchicola]
MIRTDSPDRRHDHPALACEDRRIALLSEGRLDELADLLDDALVYVHSTGLVQDKAGVLDFFARVLRVERIERHIERILGESDLAAIDLTQTMHATLRANESTRIAANSYVHTLWRRTNGTWRLLHFQSTAVPAA